jgi:8-oxo-dGTP pyrophosphatase MutT (NUDIX family)/GNAT superfamily N-acetyltransferase
VGGGVGGGGVGGGGVGLGTRLQRRHAAPTRSRPVETSRAGTKPGYADRVRFELVRQIVEALPRELPAAPAILTPIRLDSPEGFLPAGSPGRGRASAVLVLLFPDAEGQARVLLTARAPHGIGHAGEISFPGGSADREDTDPIATALREAAEEVGLDPEACGLRVTGGLEVFALTVSGFRITPVVAVAERRPETTPSPDEVARIIEAPVEAFLPDAPVELEERTIRRRLIRYGVYPVEGERVWGATARMLGQLGAALAVPMGGARPDIGDSGAATHLAGGSVAATHPEGKVSVRTATPADAPAIDEFLEAMAPELAHRLPPASELLIADSSGTVVGLASWAPWDRPRSEEDPRGFDGLDFPDGDVPAELTLLAVAPHLRGRGIGRGLTRAVAEAAAAAGCTRLLAWTLADAAIHPSSIAARTFFRGAGFADVAVDRRVQARGEDRLLTSRPIKSEH